MKEDTMKKNTLPQLRELLVDNCDDALKQEAISVYNEIEEALLSAHEKAVSLAREKAFSLADEKARINTIKERYNLAEGAIILSPKYDAAIEGVIKEKGVLVYSAEKCFDILYPEMIEAIHNYDKPLYIEADISVEESARFYAIDRLERLSSNTSPKAPFFLYCSRELLGEGV